MGYNRFRRYKQFRSRKVNRKPRTEYRQRKKLEKQDLMKLKIKRWTVILFFSIFTALSIGIGIMNDDSTRDTIKTIWLIVSLVVAFFFLVSFIRYKRGSE